MPAGESSEIDGASVRHERADARRNRVRILAAAEEVFAERGPSGSTDEVARRAGVAIGTVFRHFPTKQTLLQAIMKNLLDRLRDDADQLAASGDPRALFTFFSDLVREAAAKKTVIDLLADAGIQVPVDGPLLGLSTAIRDMLDRGQRSRAIRSDASYDAVFALLISTTQGALRAGWSPDVQRRVLRVVFDGLSWAGTRAP